MIFSGAALPAPYSSLEVGPLGPTRFTWGADAHKVFEERPGYHVLLSETCALTPTLKYPNLNPNPNHALLSEACALTLTLTLTTRSFPRRAP